MKKRYWLLTGIIIGLILFILSVLLKHYNLFATIAAVGGLISLFLSGTAVGAFISGDRVRANYWIESKDTRKDRGGFAFRTFLLGAPLLISALCIYFIR